jgi:hypothetical protein
VTKLGTFKQVFVSFGAGSQDYENAARRIEKEAQTLEWFDEILVFTDFNSPDHCKRIYNQTPNYRHHKGFGWWTWKPLILLDVFDRLSEGDVVCFADVGCQFSPSGELAYKQYVNATRVYGNLFFAQKRFLEYQYTKASVFKRLGVVPKMTYITHTPQFWAGYNFWKVGSGNRNLLEDWRDLCFERNFNLVDETNSVGIIPNKFRAHRHDQSLLSILAKQRSLKAIYDPTQYNNFAYYPQSKALLTPIHTLRSRSGSQRYRIAFTRSSPHWIVNDGWPYLAIKTLLLYFHVIVEIALITFNVDNRLLTIKSNIRSRIVGYLKCRGLIS